jgi:hypothetical protein
MIIATVVEGPTDRLVLEAILSKLIPGEHRFLALQPTTTFGETGTGWKGVRRWCRETWQRAGSSLGTILSSAVGPPLDLLVIHVDASIASETDLQADEDLPVEEVQLPCPPAIATASRLRQVIAHWLRCGDSFPPQVILAIPAQDTESWTFAALFPNDPLCARPDYECIRSGRDHPAYRLTLAKYGRLLQRSEGRIKKPERNYRAVAPKISDVWETVCRICSQAERFSEDILMTSRSAARAAARRWPV